MFGFFKDLFGMDTPSVPVMTQTHIPGHGTTTEITDLSSGISTPVGFEPDTHSFDNSSDDSFGGGFGGGMDFD